MKLNLTPFKVILPSTISLVVPAISVTIALFSSNNLLSKLLFPTLGLPTKATVIPSFKILPFSDVSKMFAWHLHIRDNQY